MEIKYAKVYYIGVYKNRKTVYLQASTNVDCLNCEITDYFGARLTTKKDLMQRKNLFLSFLKTDINYAKKYINCTKIVVL